MLSGTFAYHEMRARVSGIRDSRGVYHVMVGHHRIVAALEIMGETGNATPLRELLRWGFWDQGQDPLTAGRCLRDTGGVLYETDWVFDVVV